MEDKITNQESETQESKKLEILIENFNILSNKYELGIQQICKSSIEDLESLLKLIPSIKDNITIIPVRIITKDFIFIRFDEADYIYEFNYIYSYFEAPNTPLIKRNSFKIDEFESILKKPKKKRISIIFSSIFQKIWLIYPIINIIAFISIIFDEFGKSVKNLIIISFMLWLIIFCFYSFIFGLMKIRLLNKKPQKVAIKYDFPFLSLFETLDASEFIVLIGQIILIVFNQLYNVQIDIANIIVLTSTIISISIYLFDFNHHYKRNKRLKSVSLNLLFSKLYSEIETNEKQYYFQMAKSFKNKPLISVEKVPKFLTLLSIFLTFIPIITYFFII